MSAPTDNVGLALRLGGADPADWLTRSDRHADATFRALLAHGRTVEACDFLLAHLTGTERTRRGLDPFADNAPPYGGGPAPSWEDALDVFRCAADRQQPAQIETLKRLLARIHEAAS